MKNFTLNCYTVKCGKLNKLELMNEIKERIEKVNLQLLDRGYTWRKIEAFWMGCIKESKEKIKKKKVEPIEE